MLRSSATSFYNADGLGSISSLGNAAGSLAQTYTFDSFGKQTASTGSLVNPFQYTAREKDTETGLYYYRARYYDSNAGRFSREDPVAFAGGVNFYGYIGNSAPNNPDPFGLAPLTRQQCNELRRVLNLESKYGTYIASWLGNITFNPHGILADFNSQNDDYQPVPTAYGPVNLDWFATVQAAGIPGPIGKYMLPPFFIYGYGKVAWNLIRLTVPHAPPVNNLIPYRAPDETRAAFLATLPFFGYKNLFPPAWMKKNCPGGCDNK